MTASSSSRCFRVLGGALLLGQDLPIEADPVDVTAGLGFFERAAQALGDTDPAEVIYELVERVFTLAPDVPMTWQVAHDLTA